MTELRPPYHIAGGGDTPDRILQQACDVVQQHWPAVEYDDQVHGELAVPPRVDAAISSWIRQANDAALDSVHHRLGLLEQAKQVACAAVGAGWLFRSVEAFETALGTVWVVLFRREVGPPHRVEMRKTLVVSQDFDGVMVVCHASMLSM